MAPLPWLTLELGVLNGEEGVRDEASRLVAVGVIGGIVEPGDAIVDTGPLVKVG